MNDESIYKDEDEIVYDEKRREWMTNDEQRLHTIIDKWEKKLRVYRDISYIENATKYQKLDIYTNEYCNNGVVVWIHGGAWKLGTKSSVGNKPDFFNRLGYTLVSVEYTMRGGAGYKEQCIDVANAIRWIRDNIGKYANTQKSIYLMGHSSGAHIASLLSLDDRYLNTVYLSTKDIDGTILIDGAGYDIQRQIETGGIFNKLFYLSIFGFNKEELTEASPTTYIRLTIDSPRFFITFCDNRKQSKSDALNFHELLISAKKKSTIYYAYNKNHISINENIGNDNDDVTMEISRFLKEI